MNQQPLPCYFSLFSISLLWSLSFGIAVWPGEHGLHCTAQIYFVLILFGHRIFRYGWNEQPAFSRWLLEVVFIPMHMVLACNDNPLSGHPPTTSTLTLHYSILGILLIAVIRFPVYDNGGFYRRTALSAVSTISSNKTEYFTINTPNDDRVEDNWNYAIDSH